MSEVNRALPKCSDQAVISFFRRVEEKLQFQPFQLRLYGSSTGINMEDGASIIERLSVGYSHSIEYISAHRPNQNPNVSGASLTFFRGASKLERSGSYAIEPSLISDSLRIVQNAITPNEALILNDLVDEELIGKVAPQLQGKLESSDLRDLVTSHHQLITALHQQMVEVGNKYAAARIHLEDEISDRKKQLDEAASIRLKELEVEHAGKLAALDSERSRLAERQELLDDRDNTHVRREIRKQLKEQLASYRDKFELTSGTRKLRQPVTVAVAVIEAICLTYLSYFLYAYPNEGVDIWSRLYVWVKTFALSFLAVGTAVWYLRWLTQWSNRHADAEFQLKQLELDVDRASWVVETAFEWKSSQESSIPESLLAAISRNLFDAAGSKTDKEESPLDHLASALLGEASKARIKLAGGHEVDFERKALKQAGQG